MKRYHSIQKVAACLAALLILGSSQQLASTAKAADQQIKAKPVPLIYGTDLFHPHDDPDDHFDLATVFAMPELDVKAILLDLGARQNKKPGRIPVEQMFKITGRRAPYATGLNKKLKSLDDDGRDQPKEDQGAIELLLKTLRESPEPVVMVTAGSIRDTCAAFNRDPELMRKKISKLYINIGSLLEDQGEWNEHLDPQAYIGLMRSGLPIYWCPCRPTKQNRTSHWMMSKHSEVLSDVPPVLLNYFIYALRTIDPKEIDPLKALDMDLRPQQGKVMEAKRNMWCTSSLIHAAGRKIYKVGDHWVAAASPPENGRLVELFTFVPARVEIVGRPRKASAKKDAKNSASNSKRPIRAFTKWDVNAPNPNMHLYKVLDPENHQEALKSCLRDLFRDFPAVIKPEQK